MNITIKEPAYIKIFEIAREIPQFDEDWGFFLRENYKSILGKKLKKEETRGVPCIRVFYDDEGNMLFMEKFDQNGYCESSVNIEAMNNLAASGPQTESLVEKPDEKFVDEGSYVTKLFDAQAVLIHLPQNSLELKIEYEGSTMLFRKISPCPFDLYIKDPEYLPYDEFGPEKSLYCLGYKLIENKRLNVDGTIDCGRHRHYNKNGLFIEQEFYCGTPWGGIVTYERQEWQYDYENRRVIMRNICARNGVIIQIHCYSLDKTGRICHRREYERPHKQAYIGRPEDIGIPEGMISYRNLDYHYDDDGRISEIRRIHFVSPEVSGRDTFEYDTKGRLICEKNYDKDGELTDITTYEYLNRTQMRVNYQLSVL